MRIETMIYIYIWLCISLVFFNFFWVFWKVYDDKQHIEKRTMFQKKVYEQLLKISEGTSVDKTHVDILSKMLTNVKYLMAFHDMLMIYQVKGEEQLDEYLESIRPVFTHLALEYAKASVSPIFTLLVREYAKKNVMDKAYLAYVISEHKIYSGNPPEQLVDVLITYMEEDSIYCRENVMRALYGFGNINAVLRGIKILNNQDLFYNIKLLSDGLLTYSGNHKDMCRALWNNFYQYRIPIRIAIINYFRFKGEEYRQELFALLIDPKTDEELKFAIMRYFGRHYYEPAKGVLIGFLQITEKDKWEFPALAAHALASYSCKEVIEALENSMSSHNWYVRLNSAKTLLSLDADHTKAASILNGNDRFARDIVQYIMEQNDNRNAEKALTGVKNI